MERAGILDRVLLDIEEFEEKNKGNKCSYLLLDSPSYFDLKVSFFGDEVEALSQELTNIGPVKIFHNMTYNQHYELI